MRPPVLAVPVREASPSRYSSGNAGDGGELKRESRRTVSSAARVQRPLPSGSEAPTSPAFMKLLSQRSPKTPQSQRSRSPSVMSQLSGRRRVSSPTIAARAWLGSSSDTASQSQASLARANGDSERCFQSREQNAASSQEYAILTRSRGTSIRRKSREDHDEPEEKRGQSSSWQGHRGHKPSHKSSKRKEGAMLVPREKSASEVPSSACRPPPRQLISPRRLPPPTFEKILLGLVDADFASTTGDADVFGAERAKETAFPETQQEDDCTSVSVSADPPEIVIGTSHP